MRNTWKRVTAAAALSVGLLATAACGGGDPSTGDGEGSASESLKLAVQEPFSAFLVNVAEQEGYLEDAGISEVTPTNFTSIPAMMTAIAQGQMDFGVQVLPAVTGFNAEATEDGLVKFFDINGINGVYWAAAKDAGLPTIEEAGDWQSVVKAWSGKTIGVVQLGGLAENYVRFMAQEAGLDPAKDLKFVATGGGPAAVAAMQQGLVDVVSGSSSIMALVESGDAGYQMLSVDQGPEQLHGVLSSGFIASAEALDSDAERYQGLSEAIGKARAFVADPANEDAVLKTLTETVGLPADVASIVYQLDHENVFGNASLDQATYDRSIDALVTTGSLPGTPPAFEDVVATDFASSGS